MERHLSPDQSMQLNALLQPILEYGQEGFLQALGVLLNQAMLIEREQALNAAPYERTPERKDQGNGFKKKDLHTRMGGVTVKVPQTRNLSFYPSCLEKGQRSERALNCAIAEMYVQGVSTRKVTAVLEEMCGLEVSSTQVSRVAAQLDEELENWRNRPLGSHAHLIVDARYEKVRVDHCVRDCALLIAYGVTPEGKRSVLGLSVSLSEAEVHWRAFFESLVKRGLCGLKSITSDDHAGLKAARKAVFGSVPWQRCQFHLQQNATAYIPSKSMQKEVHDDIRDIFNAANLEQAREMLKKAVEKYDSNASELSRWMERNIPEGLAVFTFAENKDHRRKLRTSNMAELQNKELKKRTRLISVFPNQAALLRIASAMLSELDEKWLGAEKKYLSSEQ